jgi:lysophospholipase L1-like esterase
MIVLLCSVFNAISIIAAEDSLLIDDFEDLSRWQVMHPTNFAEIHADDEAHEGKSALAVKVVSSRGFVNRKIKSDATWDEAGGISFWLKGDGSKEWGCVRLEGVFQWLAVFPLNNKEWHEVRFAWADFAAPCTIGCAEAYKPSATAAISFGRLVHFLHPDDKPFSNAASLSFSIDELRIIKNISSSRPRVPLAQFASFEKVEKKLKNNEPVSILSLGDSTSIGKYPGFLGKELSRHYGNDKIKVYKRAIAGGTTSTNRAWLKPDMEGVEPDIVMLMIGHNQCPRSVAQLKPDSAKNFVADFVLYLEEVAGITRTAPCAIIMTPNPSGGSDESWPVFDSFADGLRDICRQNRHVILADLYQHFKTFAREDYKLKFAADGIHPNTEGEREIARVLFKGIVPTP